MYIYPQFLFGVSAHVFEIFIFETLLTLYSFFQSDEMRKYVFIYNHITALTSRNFLCIAYSKIMHGRGNTGETKWCKSSFSSRRMCKVVSV